MTDTKELMENIAPLSIQEIMELIPHRYPFLLVDRVLELIPTKSIKAYKNVTANEAFFQGHFPDQPVMPGVLMIESMAQVCILLALKSQPAHVDLSKKLFVFSGIDNVRFRKQVGPGDRLEIVCENPRNKLALWKMQAKAYVDGQLVVEADLTAAMVDKD